MNKRIAGLLGAAAAVTAMTGAQAAPAQPAPAQPASYRDLLEPIPNAIAQLKADDAARALTDSSAKLELVQFHHHHHHHHHHHNGFFPGAVIGGVIGGLLAAPRPCYWTWSRPFWNGYRWVRRRVEVCR